MLGRSSGRAQQSWIHLIPRNHVRAQRGDGQHSGGTHSLLPSGTRKLGMPLVSPKQIPLKLHEMSLGHSEIVSDAPLCFLCFKSALERDFSKGME